MDEQYVLERYDAAIKFIDNYGHAYISNGPFYLSKFDSTSNFMELRAFRDPSYPFEDTYWIEELKVLRLETTKYRNPRLHREGQRSSSNGPRCGSHVPD